MRALAFSQHLDAGVERGGQIILIHISRHVLKLLEASERGRRRRILRFVGGIVRSEIRDLRLNVVEVSKQG